MKLKATALMLSLLILGCSKSPEETVNELVRSGYENLDDFEYEKAEVAFDRAGIEAKTVPYDRMGTGLILEQQRFYFDALNEYLILTEQYPNFAPAFSGVYRIYSYYGYYDKALSASNAGYELAADSSQFAVDQFRALVNYNRTAQARQLAEGHRKALDELSLQFLLARSYCALNDFDSAKIVLGKALVQPPSSVQHYELLADALESLGLVDSSMSASRKATEHPDARVSDLNEHFDRALRNNYHFDARQVVRQLEKRGADKATTLTMEVLIAKSQKQFPKAQIINFELASITPQNISSHFFDMTAAGSLFIDPTVTAAFASIIQSKLQNLGFQPELQEFVKTELELFNSTTDNKVGAWKTIRLLTGEFANTPKVLLTEAELRYKTGQFEDALNYLAKLRQSKANHADWLISIADIYADPEIKKHELAQETYEQALSKDKWNKRAFYNKVQHLRKINKTEEALNEFTKYPNFEKNFHDIALLKALCLCHQKEYSAAIEIFESHGAFVKGDLGPFYELTEILEQNYRKAEILNLANTCADWSAENADIVNFSARLLCDNGEFESALKLVDKSLTIEPTSDEAKIQRARALYELGQRIESFELLDQVINNDPNSGDANYYYSSILSKEKIDGQRATNMARSAVRSFYSDKKAFTNLCKAYLAFGQDKFAHGEARSAVKLFPDSPELWYLLGLASNKLGRADTENNLNKAIELGLQGEDLSSAKDILAKL